MLITLERWPHGSLNEQVALQLRCTVSFHVGNNTNPNEYVLWMKDSLRVWKGTQ